MWPHWRVSFRFDEREIVDRPWVVPVDARDAGGDGNRRQSREVVAFGAERLWFLNVASLRGYGGGDCGDREFCCRSSCPSWFFLNVKRIDECVAGYGSGCEDVRGRRRHRGRVRDESLHSCRSACVPSLNIIVKSCSWRHSFSSYRDRV
jgi:hypothetical protein